jgi:hypothetical protein
MVAKLPPQGHTSALRILWLGSRSEKATQTDGLPLNISEITNRTRKRTNNTWAIHAEVPAIPVNPNIPAIIAMIKKTIA